MMTSNRTVSVEKILEKVNLLDGRVWGCGPISLEEIQEAIERGTNQVPPYNSIKDLGEPKGDWRLYHIARIAELARGEIDDQSSDYPIIIGVSTDPDDVTIEEGRHRLVAASVKGQETLCVKIIEIEDGDYDRLFSGV